MERKSHSFLHTFIQTAQDDYCVFILIELKAPVCTCQMETRKWISDSHYVIGALRFKYLRSSVFCFVLICLWSNWVKSMHQTMQVNQGGLLDRLIKKRVQHIHSTSTSHVLQYVFKTRTCISGAESERRSFHSIKYQVYARPKIFSSFHLFAGKIHIAHFSVCIKQRPFGIKTKRLRSYDPRSLKSWYHTACQQYVCITVRT